MQKNGNVPKIKNKLEVIRSNFVRFRLAWNALPENIRANQDCEVFFGISSKLIFYLLAFNVH